MLGFAGLWGLLSIVCLCTVWYVWHGYEALTEQAIASSAQIIYTVVCVLLALLFALWTRDSYKQAKEKS